MTTTNPLDLRIGDYVRAGLSIDEMQPVLEAVEPVRHRPRTTLREINKVNPNNPKGKLWKPLLDEMCRERGLPIPGESTPDPVPPIAQPGPTKQGGSRMTLDDFCQANGLTHEEGREQLGLKPWHHPDNRVWSVEQLSSTKTVRQQPVSRPTVVVSQPPLSSSTPSNLQEPDETGRPAQEIIDEIEDWMSRLDVTLFAGFDIDEDFEWDPAKTSRPDSAGRVFYPDAFGGRQWLSAEEVETKWATKDRFPVTSPVNRQKLRTLYIELLQKQKGFAELSEQKQLNTATSHMHNVIRGKYTLTQVISQESRRPTADTRARVASFEAARKARIEQMGKDGLLDSDEDDDDSSDADLRPSRTARRVVKSQQKNNLSLTERIADEVCDETYRVFMGIFKAHQHELKAIAGADLDLEEVCWMAASAAVQRLRGV